MKSELDNVFENNNMENNNMENNSIENNNIENSNTLESNHTLEIDISEIRKKAKEFVAQMTLEEKASLCSGKDCWNLKSIERLGLSSITMMDGPHGLRKQVGDGDNLGIGDSLPSVCFPTASAMACSFDRELVYQVGRAIGEECLQEDVSVILGPGVNQKRSPLCGRNFEYFSEDPLLSGELGASLIQGVQTTGIGTSLKHFAVNNQEKRRMTMNAVIDERALRETYLKAFEIAVKKGRPDTVMCAYNRLNGVYCSENQYLLTEILRKEWGFEGAVISDWGAVNDRVLGVKAGLDLEMPGNNGYNDAKIIAAVNKGELTMEALDSVAYRVTELILKSMKHRVKGYHYDPIKHHNLAVQVLEQSAVLLKNEDHILPGNKKQKVAVIGRLAKMPRYQGAGSSKLHPITIENAWDSLMELGVDAAYADGYREKKRNGKRTETTQELQEQNLLIYEACEIAKDKDIVYLFAGLTEGYESEGFDRSDLRLPGEQNRLIEAVTECNPNVVVILSGGAPMELPWIHKVKAVLLTYLGGEGVGRATANLLLGKSVPSGKLAESWPIRLSDNPSYHYFPGGNLTVEYRESIYVGYRYYEKAKIPVLFPFGHGLSYTNFTYSNIQLDRSCCEYGDRLKVSFQIKNVGTVAAKETAFIFVGHDSEKVSLPKKELREFVKVDLQPGETREVLVELDTATFGYYNTIIRDWYAEAGSYEIIVGTSLADCSLRSKILLNSPDKPQPEDLERISVYERLSSSEFIMERSVFEEIYGKKLPVSEAPVTRPYHRNHTLDDVKHTLIGKIMIRYAKSISKKVTKDQKEQEGMMSAMIREMPFQAIVASGEGMISESMMEGLLELLNGHYLRGLKKLLR
jgi:beta-glucosidase